VAESQAPLSRLNQFLPYLKDHLLLDRNVDTLIIKPFTRTAYGQFSAAAASKMKEIRPVVAT
jgi:hypothetical protein